MQQVVWKSVNARAVVHRLLSHFPVHVDVNGEACVVYYIGYNIRFVMGVGIGMCRSRYARKESCFVAR